MYKKEFTIIDNSDILEKPLCIYVPFIGPVNRKEETGKFKTITHAQVSVPLEKLSDTLRTLQSEDRLQIEFGNEHLIMLTLDGGGFGLSRDFRPDLPLIINW